MSNSRRALFGLARAAAQNHPSVRCQHSLSKQHGSVNIQPVRFRQVPITARRSRRFILKSALTGLLLYYMSGYIFEKDTEWEEDEEEGGDDGISHAKMIEGVQETAAVGGESAMKETAEDLFEQLPEKLPEDALFIPLWWGKQRPREFYKGSDPEWQGYTKFGRDKAKLKQVKSECAKIGCEMLLSQPSYVKGLGAPCVITHHWIDVDFPLSPPPEYDRPGLEITDDYVALTIRPQSSLNHRRVKLALWPDSMAKAFWSSLKVYGSIQYARVKGLLNAKPEKQGSGIQLPGSPLDIQNLPQTTDGQSSAARSQLDQRDGQGPADTKVKGSSSAAESTSRGQGNTVIPDTSQVLSLLPSFRQEGGDIGLAATTFYRTLAQTWHQPFIVDRGAVHLSGLVRVSGTKASVILDLRATYHPETRELKLFQIALRRGAPHKLSPMDRR